ncbi:hypothetical protein BJX76DRAFT_319934 [Aspergillus varians]
MTDMYGFLQRVAHAQRTSKIVQFRLGPKKIYMVSGENLKHECSLLKLPSTTCGLSMR